jgi:hypothetical protein
MTRKKISRRHNESGKRTPSVAEWTAASTKASKVPLKVADKQVLRQIARMLKRG